MAAQDGLTVWGAPLRMNDLSDARTYKLSIVPNDTNIQELIKEMNVDALRKVSFKGTLVPVGKRDWQLTATLGATVVQPCVATLEPVTTRIETTVTRLYLKDLKEEFSEEDVEIPEDDTTEPLPAELILSDVAVESLALNIPAYPRKDGAIVEPLRVTEPGVDPMSDEAAKPFAGLQALKDKLEKKGD